jgi:SPP1 gp7 family putative phage head morphogenesis protein
VKTTSNVLHFDEAILWFRQRLEAAGYLPDVEGLLEDLLQQARTIAATAQLDLANAVYGGLQAAVAKGETFNDFKARITEVLQRQWGGLASAPASRLDAIFRTNVQRAYSAGRLEQYEAPDIIETRPVWRYSAVLDARTSEICNDCAGVTLPASHPWWKTHRPPLHHRCRSTIMAMTERAAKVVGVTKRPPKVDVPEGFGNPVREFRPDLREYPRALARNYKGPK